MPGEVAGLEEDATGRAAVSWAADRRDGGTVVTGATVVPVVEAGSAVLVTARSGARAYQYRDQGGACHPRAVTPGR